MEVYEASHASNPNALATTLIRNQQNTSNFFDEIKTEGFFKALKHNIDNSASTPFIIFEQYRQKISGTLNDQIKELENDLESGKYQDTEKTEAETRLQELEGKLEQNMDTWRTYASGTATLNNSFKDLESEQQASISNFLNNMSADFIEGNGLASQQNMYQFVNTFINGLKDKQSDISEAFNSLLEFNVDDPELNPQEIQSALDSIIRQLLQALKDAGYNVDTSEEGIARFKVSYGFEFVDTNAEDYERISKHFYDSGDTTKKPDKQTTQAINEEANELRTALLEYGLSIQEIESWVEKFRTGTLDAVYGNIDLNNRQILQWTDDTIKYYKEHYKQAFSDWGLEDVQAGDISTVLGGSGEYGLGNQTFTIGYSPMLQTEGREPVLLTKQSLDEYIASVLDVAAENDGEVSLQEILKIDAEGTGYQYGGQIVKGMIAGVSDNFGNDSEKQNAGVSSVLMHWFEIGKKLFGKETKLSEKEFTSWKKKMMLPQKR